MLSRLTQVEVADDDGVMQQLDDGEIAGFGTLIGGAGAETVTKLVANAVVLFDRHPEQWQMVLDDPSCIPQAVEEILRYYPPSQYQGRYAPDDVTLHGVTIPAGTPTILITGAAVRDERAYDDPDRFDITRPPSLSLGFGYGIHSCLGAALARMESRVAIEELAKRFPRYEVRTRRPRTGPHVERRRLLRAYRSGSGIGRQPVSSARPGRRHPRAVGPRRTCGRCRPTARRCGRRGPDCSTRCAG